MGAIALGTTLLVLIACWFWWQFISDMRSPGSHKLSRRAVVLNKSSPIVGSSGNLHTEYFVSFTFMDGREPEEENYKVPGRDFNLLDKNDVVDVLFNGKDYLGFNRVSDSA
ncbi:hypothetical protein IQ260_11015 [Leptolyngbya cf. ectocarpi LEGE 11479]|uniref:DUF2500 domain-containing protein n=1 Tax=Leptolyngbya cf. ectocarpi LEGE 11479 TaxID=1828722 RepID=A0A928X4E4_LEPEC|nr:hypothetical protein [Leptolyngbya ectocarpi]MBE9067186.1 hypothetical protein [Leptolyngbya cf. ectocarpi LEGE 11479]